MIDKAILQQLQQIVGADYLTTEPADLTCYAFDATQRRYLPDVVIYPHNAAEIAEILKLANTHRIPVVPRGSGSGFSGGSLPIEGGIELVLRRMDRILEIDEDNMIAVVEPGVVTETFQKAVEAHGLFYPPDPASLKFSSMGGNVAECAGGPRCVKYGVTRDYILGLEVVTPTGDIINTGGRTMKGVVGYDLTRLFVGSEGTLGVVTQIIVKLIPKPAAVKTMLITFDSIRGASQAVSHIVLGRIIPTTLEFMDSTSLDVVRKATNIVIPEQVKAVLVVEVDGEPELLEKQAQQILTIVQPFGVVDTKIAQNKAESDDIWKLRRSISPSLRTVNPNKFNEDICVPRSRIPDMIVALEKISSEVGVPIINFGHAGDGNIHVNVMVDLATPGMDEKVERALRAIFEATLQLGGTISGEHGIGITKAPYLRMELKDKVIDYMRLIKRALDPNNILNPGKIFGTDGGQ
ncbi:MAG: FAD-binding protein [Deltaproteobacteria bacterium]|nr:FAD-binding protein [Deltaproteobacteria bacterium]